MKINMDGVTLNPNLKLKRPYSHSQKSLNEILQFKTNNVNQNLIDDNWYKNIVWDPQNYRANCRDHVHVIDTTF